VVRILRILLVCLACMAVAAWPQDNRESAGLLEPDKPAVGRLALPGGSVRWSFRIPAPAFGVRIELSGTQVDLSLAISEKNEVLLENKGRENSRRLIFTRLTEPAAATGEYELELAHRFAGAPLDFFGTSARLDRLSDRPARAEAGLLPARAGQSRAWNTLA
jgi:hypothetical protein